jgi:hypothetical protein
MSFVCRRGEPYEYMDPERGLNLFSVSQIRKVAHDPYLGIPDEVLDEARTRGTMLHKRFMLVLAWRANLCNWPAIIQKYAGYCQSMDDWADRNNAEPVKFEEMSYSLKFGFAGTPDALVRIGKKRRLTLLDLKTGAVNLTDKMQLIAYHKMEGYEEADDLLDLYIQADGSFAVEKPVTKGEQATEWAWFLSALGVLQSRTNHGVR